MVNTLLSSMATAIGAVDDSFTLLQVSAALRYSKGQRIISAVAEEGGDTICVEAATGNVAPVAGSFTAKMSQQSLEVAAGSVAEENGSFCVLRQDVLLLQRTYGLNTARDFDAALGTKQKKKTTTTTTRDREIFDWEGDVNKTVTVNLCPNVKAELVQTMDATVADKQQKQQKLDADEVRVCACRNFLTSSVGRLLQLLFERENGRGNNTVENAEEQLGQLLIQRSFDAALATKKPNKQATTTTTTTIPAGVTPLTMGCTIAAQLKDWAGIAKLINHPDLVPVYQSVHVTAGWEHCDKSWVVHGACGGSILDPSPIRLE